MNKTAHLHRLCVLLLALPCVVFAADTNDADAKKSAAVPESRPGRLIGYLPTTALPNSLALLPAPPAQGSAALALDEELSRSYLALRDTPRFALAALDADLSFPNAAGTFSCAVNAPITEADTPHLYVLLRRTLADAGLATYAAKNRYQRDRPFEANNEPICTPDIKVALAKDGSYPSGHAAIGWAWALILTEIAPEQTDAILMRGKAFGESRNVCNLHWFSDVTQTRMVAAGTVARLHADPTFSADLAAAKLELAAVRAKRLKPIRDCAGEAAALAVEPASTK